MVSVFPGRSEGEVVSIAQRALSSYIHQLHSTICHSFKLGVTHRTGKGEIPRGDKVTEFPWLAGVDDVSRNDILVME